MTLTSIRRAVATFRAPATFFASCFVLVMIAGCAGPTVQPRARATQPKPAPAEIAAPAPQPLAAPESPELEAFLAPDRPDVEVTDIGPDATDALLAQERDVIRVALLLPLSGPAEALGTAMLNAAQMALFDTFGDNMVLLPKDTAGTAEGAERAITEALAVDRADLVLGPLFSASVSAVAPLARGADVPVLAFSNDRSAAGQGVYLLGFTPQEQIARIASYAVRQGYTRLAALVPETPYGDAVVDALFRAAERTGAVVDRVEFFAADGSNITEVVERLASNKGTGLPANERSFDAVIVGASGQQLRAIAPLFPYFDLDTAGIQMLGTETWLHPGLHEEPALIGAWFAAPPPGQWETFRKRYEAIYGALPPRRAVLAYDAAALAGALARVPPESSGGVRFAEKLLTARGGFAGTDGVFRLNPDGVVQRALAVYAITEQGFEVISPAPKGFGRGSF